MTHPDAAALLEGTTPGPWLSNYKSYFDAVIIHTQGERIEGEVKTLWIARALEGHRLLSEAVNANARLIAAAPDLAARVIELEAEVARLKANIFNVEIGLASGTTKQAAIKQLKEARTRP